MRDFHDFDRRFRQRQKRFDAVWRITMTLIVLAWIGMATAIGWLILHPEAVGSWLGRLVGTFTGGEA